ncbi:MAG: hypothetical protein IPG45_06805 [Deltaproteobacteria bacterium]|jgi:hypothetical protein|nr:hypothetical protein [Deltaproteobacteria bacterium]
MTAASENEDGEDHPIVDAVVSALEADLDGRYHAPAQATLNALIDVYLDDAELPFVVDALIRLAHVLEVEADSPAAASALCAAVEREPVLAALRGLTVELQQEREAERTKGPSFRDFAETERPLAPQHDERPSEGVVRLDAFKAPRRV